VDVSRAGRPGARSFASISSLLSLLSFLMGTNTLLDVIPTYSVLNSLQTTAAPTIEGKVRHLRISGKLNLLINLNGYQL